MPRFYSAIATFAAAFSIAGAVFFGVVSSEAQAAEPQPKELKLGASDLAILYPLKPTAAPDDIFPVAGDGMCNAPSVQEDSLLSHKDFSSLVDQVFGVQSAIQPPPYLELPDDRLSAKQLARKRYYRQWTDLEEAKANRQQQLSQVAAAYASGDYAEPLFCYQPRLAGGIADLDHDYQLELGHHLVQSEGVQRIACDYSAWRVVGIRFNPCLEQAELPGFWQGNRLPKACTTREFRLVLQPAYRKDGQVAVADLAMHFIYRISLADSHAIVEALRNLKGLHPSLTDPNTLAPHSGLVAEMNSCDGKVAKALRSLVTTFATKDRLSSVAWLSSAPSQSQWSFGTIEAKAIFHQHDPEAEEILESLPASISLKELSKRVDRFPFNPDAMDEHELSVAPVFQKPFRNPIEPITDGDILTEAKAVFDQLDALENPTLISQVAGDPHRFSSDCFSCHTMAQGRKLLSDAVAGAVKGSEAQLYRNRKGEKLKPWALLPSRRLTNFRNFGYGPGSSDRFLPAISTRVSHEALNLVDVVHLLMSGETPAKGAQED